MAIREKLNANKAVGMIVGALLLAIAAVALGYQLLSGRVSGNAPVSNHAFYTDDNGKTFFTDNINRIVPFDHDGKQAYRADVFKGADGTEFVGLIYRHTESGRQQMEAYLPKASQDPEGITRDQIEHRDGMQVRRAHADSAWVPNEESVVDRVRSSIRDASGKPATLVQP